MSVKCDPSLDLEDVERTNLVRQVKRHDTLDPTLSSSLLSPPFHLGFSVSKLSNSESKQLTPLKFVDNRVVEQTKTLWEKEKNGNVHPNCHHRFVAAVHSWPLLVGLILQKANSVKRPPFQLHGTSSETAHRPVQQRRVQRLEQLHRRCLDHTTTTTTTTRVTLVTSSTTHQTTSNLGRSQQSTTPQKERNNPKAIWKLVFPSYVGTC